MFVLIVQPRWSSSSSLALPCFFKKEHNAAEFSHSCVKTVLLRKAMKQKTEVTCEVKWLFVILKQVIYDVSLTLSQVIHFNQLPVQFSFPALRSLHYCYVTFITITVNLLYTTFNTELEDRCGEHLALKFNYKLLTTLLQHNVIFRWATCEPTMLLINCLSFKRGATNSLKFPLSAMVFKAIH